MKTDSIVIANEVYCVFCYSYINNITVGSRLNVLPKHLIYDGNVNSLTLKDGITTISSYLVSNGNESLTMLIVPKTVTKIENNAFSNWKALTTIINKTGKAFDWDATFNFIYQIHHL